MNRKAIDLLSDNLSLSHRYQTALLDEHRQLDVLQAKIDEQHRLDELTQRIEALELASNNLYRQNVAIQQ